MPRSTGWTWERWETCVLCGREYRTSLMTTQRSQRVCTFRPCYDTPNPAAVADNSDREYGEPLEVADERR